MAVKANDRKRHVKHKPASKTVVRCFSPRPPNTHTGNEKLRLKYP